MSTDLDIQRLSLELRFTSAQEREAILRPLARLIARRLMAEGTPMTEGLAEPDKTGKTIDPERQEALV
jgi:hypothetical protein